MSSGPVNYKDGVEATSGVGSKGEVKDDVGVEDKSPVDVRLKNECEVEDEVQVMDEVRVENVDKIEVQGEVEVGVETKIPVEHAIRVNDEHKVDDEDSDEVQVMDEVSVENEDEIEVQGEVEVGVETKIPVEHAITVKDEHKVEDEDDDKDQQADAVEPQMASSNAARKTTMGIVTSVLNTIIYALMSISAMVFFVTDADLYASVCRTMNEHTEQSIHQSDPQFSDPLIPRKDVVSAPSLERPDSSPESSMHNKTRRREFESSPLDILLCLLSWTKQAIRTRLVFARSGVVLASATGPIFWSVPSNEIWTPYSGGELLYVSSPLSPSLLDSTES